MAQFAPPYSIPVHARYRDAAFDELPKWLQNRIERYAVPSEDVDEVDEVDETDEDANLDESGDPMPVDVEFPFHKGGGYYVLSDGQIVRGSDDASAAQAEIDNAD